MKTVFLVFLLATTVGGVKAGLRYRAGNKAVIGGKVLQRKYRFNAENLKLKGTTKAEVFNRVKHLYTLDKHELVQLILEKEFKVEGGDILAPFLAPALPTDVDHALDELIQEDVTEIKSEMKHLDQASMTLSDGQKKMLDFNFEEMKRKVSDTRNHLTEYYHGGAALVDSAVLKPGDARYDAQVQALSEKFARAFVWNDKFVISVMGSSVAAGHDNCNFDSYERQMERLLSPVLATAKVELEVRNAGEGGGCGDTMSNQVWCSRHILGDETDVAHYTWTYFENGDNIPEIHERWIRWVLMMEHAPVPMIFNTGGEDKQCHKAADPSGKLFDLYAKFGFNTVCLQAGIIQHGYSGKKWGAVGDGMHSTTRYAGSAVDPFANSTADRLEARKTSLGVVFRNWHPGPLGFQVTSDAFSYIYLDAMTKALEKIEAVKASNPDEAAFHAALQKKWPKTHPVLSKTDLPKPAYCDPKLCTVDDPPACTSWEKPVYGGLGIRVVSPTDSFNPYKAKYKQTDKGWGVFVAPNEKLVPKEEQNNPQCTHLDHCGAIQGNKASGFLTLRLPRMEVGKIIVCCMSGKKCGEKLAKSGIKFIFDNKPITTELKPIYGKCVVVQEQWGAGGLNDPGGHLYLGVEVDSDSTVQISQVITL